MRAASGRVARPYNPLVRSSDEPAVNMWACTQAELRAELAAEAAAAVAVRHERLAVEGIESLRPLHSQMAAIHRRTERRHREAAERHRDLAGRLTSLNVPGAIAPELLVTVAGALGARGAALTLLGSARYEESAIASDSTAAAAQDLEFTLGEGPVHDAAESMRLVVADGTSMPARWKQYSPAVTELGVRSVAAAPLCLHGRCLGVLTAFDPPGDPTDLAVDGLARAMVDTVLVAGTRKSLMPADDRKVVHQATGMIAARLRCAVVDALAVLRARAFAENEAIGVLARRVVDREVVFE